MRGRWSVDWSGSLRGEFGGALWLLRFVDGVMLFTDTSVAVCAREPRSEWWGVGGAKSMVMGSGTVKRTWVEERERVLGEGALAGGSRRPPAS